MTSPAWTLNQSGLSPAIEQAIEAAVEKAVAKAMVDHGKAIGTLPESPSNMAITPVQGSSVGLQDIQTTSVEKRLPTEVWERIFQYLYPSQLSRVSMACRTFYDIVADLLIWPEVYAQVHSNDENHVFEGIKPVPGKNSNKDFMLRICAESFQICELCLSVYNGTDIPKDRLASLPLPVHVWRVRAFMKKATFQPLPSKRSPTDWMIRLCVGCRRNVFDHSQELLPEDSPSYFLRSI
ncbi:MAG: hypothetical protein J3Q66DRAFT_5588 [Benniella sp.]|nr:MAG: hypothetical protein J3Q66DRAFT_5588 [Benniella sp.]